MESFAPARVTGYSRKRREVGTADVNSLSTARDGARHRNSRCCTSPTPSPKALLIPSEAESPRWKQRGLFLPASYYWVMNQNDDKLSALLKQWREIEPRGNFEANVWRQIRTAAEPAIETSTGLTRRAFVVAACLVGRCRHGGCAHRRRLGAVSPSVPVQIDRPTAESGFSPPQSAGGQLLANAIERRRNEEPPWDMG